MDSSRGWKEFRLALDASLEAREATVVLANVDGVRYLNALLGPALVDDYIDWLIAQFEKKIGGPVYRAGSDMFLIFESADEALLAGERLRTVTASHRERICSLSCSKSPVLVPLRPPGFLSVGAASGTCSDEILSRLAAAIAEAKRRGGDTVVEWTLGVDLPWFGKSSVFTPSRF